MESVSQRWAWERCDNPYKPLGETIRGIMQLGLTTADLRAIGRENALAHPPRLKAAAGG
jgi:hypothetical protein